MRARTGLDRLMALCLAGAAAAALLAGPASALTEITNTRTDPVDTATAGTGNTPDDVRVAPGGRIEIDDADGTAAAPNYAIRMNSDNDIEMDGTIVVDGRTGAFETGVWIDGSGPGVIGNYTQAGIINLRPLRNNRIIDASANNTGILMRGSGGYVGNVTIEEDGEIRIAGDNARGIWFDTVWTGDFLMDGRIETDGNNSIGIHAGSVVFTTQFELDELGVLFARGEDAIGVWLEGNFVTGGFTNSGLINVSADIFNENPNDNDRARAGVLIGGDLADGFLNNGLTNPNGGAGETEIAGEALIVAFDADAAILFDPDAGDGTPIILGIGGGASDPASFRNYGAINASTTTDGDTTAIMIGNDAADQVTFLGDMLSPGSVITATTFNGNAYGLQLRGTSSVPRFESLSNISVNAGGGLTGDTAVEARGIWIRDTAVLNVLVLEGALTVNTSSANGEAFGVVDEGGQLRDIRIGDSGQIAAANIGNPGHRPVALDLRNAVGDIVIESRGNIFGDVVLGAFDDTIVLADNTIDTRFSQIFGHVDFGTGANVMTLVADAQFVGGARFGTGGSLDITATDSLIGVESGLRILVTNLTTTGDGILRFGLSPDDDPAEGRIFADGTVTLDGTNTEFQLDVTGFDPGAGGTFILIDADEIVNAPATISFADVPILFDVEGRFEDEENLGGGPRDRIYVDLTVKTAAELGLSERQETFFGPAVDALAITGSGMTTALLAAQTNEEFAEAFEQVMPDTSGRAMRLGIQRADLVQRALDLRGMDQLGFEQATKRKGRGGERTGAWVRPLGGLMSQSSDLSAGEGETPGFSGFFGGILLGLDGRLTRSITLGGMFGASSADLDSEDDEGDTLRIDSVFGGGYAIVSSGPFFFQVAGSGGISNYREVREIDALFGTGAVLRGLFTTAESDWTGYELEGSGRIGANLRFGQTFVRPSLDAMVLYANQKARREGGAGDGLDLRYDEQTDTVARVGGELMVAHAFDIQRATLTPHAFAGYRHYIQRPEERLTGAIVNRTGADIAFDVPLNPLSESEFVFGGGLGVYAAGLVFSADYKARISDGEMSHMGGLHVLVRF